MSVRLGTQKITDIVKTSEGTGGTSDYNDLVNKPQINGTVLQGNLTTDDLGIEIPKVDAYTKQETTDLINSAVSDKATIEYVDDNLNLKADKTELEKELASKADINNVYTKEDTDAEIDKKIINKADKTYVDDALDLKANISDTYTKQETDNKLDTLNNNINNKLLSKANTTSVYTKEETATVINSAIANKADKTYVDNALGLKADKEDTYTKSEIDDMFDNPTITGDTYPIGAIAPFAGVTTPQNWLLCDGREVSREIYSELFAIIGTTWGAGDGSTSFNLPDLRNRMPVGAGDDYTLASKGGEKEHTLTVDEMPSHGHEVKDISYNVNFGRADGGGGPNFPISGAGSGNSYGLVTALETGGNKPHNNMPPYTGTYYIIKAKQSAGVIATVIDTLNSSSPTDALSANMGRKLAIRNNILTAKLSQTTFSLSNTVQIPLIVAEQVGSEITLSNNTIHISENISKVKVSANFNAQMPSGGNVYGQLTIKNSDGTIFAVSGAASNVDTYNYFQMVITQRIVNVSTIKSMQLEASLSRQGTAHEDQYASCYITVEAIE